MSSKVIYTWKSPQPEGIFYVVGEEKFLGSRNDEYQKGSKISRNDDLEKNVKLLGMKPTVAGITSDHDVHARLKEYYSDKIGWDGQCGEGVLNTREAFYVKDKSLSEEEQDKLICQIVSRILTGDEEHYLRTQDWALREYQETKVREGVKKLQTQDEILMHVGMRGGKSVMAEEAAKRAFPNDTCRILVLTPFPAAIDTFCNYTVRHKSMAGFKFYNNNEFPAKGEKKFVKLVSFQKEWNRKFFRKIGEVDAIIIDETHHTSNSKRSTEILARIPHKKVIHLSGTPLNDIFSGRFTSEQIVRLDFIDLMKISKEHPDLKIYPERLNVYDVFNMRMLKEHLREYGKTNKAFMDWLNENQMFNLDAIFKHESSCETFLRYISTDNRMFVDEKFYFDPTIHKHIISYVPSVKGVQIAYKVLCELTKNPDSKFFGYKILPVNEVEGEDDLEISANMERSINEFMESNEKTLVLTCNRFTTGVTFPLMDTIFNFRRPSSAEWFFQVMFRIMTYLEGKRVVEMFNFDSEYTIQIFKEFAASRMNPDLPAEKAVLEDTFKCINYYRFLEGEPFKFGLVDVNEGYELFRKLPLSHSPSVVVKYSGNEFSKDEREALINSDVENQGTESMEIHEGQGGDDEPDKKDEDNSVPSPSPSHVPTNKEKANELSQKEERSFMEKLVCIQNNIAWTIVNNGISNVEDLLKNENIPGIVLKWNLKALYVKLFTGSHRYGWQQYINDLNYRLEKNDYLDVVVNLPALSNTDKTTPATVRSDMIEQLAPVLDSLTIDDIKEGHVFCDGCCGRGFLIFDVVERLVKRLGEEHRQEIMDAMWGIDIEPHFVKMLSALGYKNVRVGDASTEQGWAEFKTSYNCIGGKSKVKFKSIASNPPYSGSLHLDIFEQLLEHVEVDENGNKIGQLTIIEPATWLINVRKRGKAKKYDKIKKSISGHVKSIKIENLNKEFNIGRYDPLSITTVDFSKIYDTIEFECCGEKKIVNSIYDCNLIGNYDTIWSILNKVLAYGDMMNKHITNEKKSKGVWYAKYVEITSGNGGRLCGTTTRMTGFYKDETWFKSNGMEFVSGYFTTAFYSYDNNIQDTPLFKYDSSGKHLLCDRYDENGNFIPGKIADNIYGTKEELENWRHFIFNNKLPLFINIVMTIDQNNNSKEFLPWLVDKQYTDEEIYAKFGITEDEISLIDATLKKFERNSPWFKRYMCGVSGTPAQALNEQIDDVVEGEQGL